MSGHPLKSSNSLSKSEENCPLYEEMPRARKTRVLRVSESKRFCYEIFSTSFSLSKSEEKFISNLYLLRSHLPTDCFHCTNVTSSYGFFEFGAHFPLFLNCLVTSRSIVKKRKFGLQKATNLV